MKPDHRDYTSIKRINRLNNCFLTVDLIQEHLNQECHGRDLKWHVEDHIPVKFRLQAKIVPRRWPPPRRFPTWILNDTSVQDYLRTSVNDLRRQIKVFPVAYPVCLSVEHKRSDCTFLSEYSWNFATLMTDALLN